MKMLESAVKTVTIGLLAVVVILMAVASVSLWSAPAKAGRQYRVSVYSGNSHAPIRTWVVSDAPTVKFDVVFFEAMGKKITVCNNWVVEEQ